MILDKKLIDMEKLLKAVHIETFRGNKFVNKEKEIPPGRIFKIRNQYGCVLIITNHVKK